MLGPYHQGDIVNLLQWDGVQLRPSGSFKITDERCQPKRTPHWIYTVVQTTYTSVK